MLLDCAHRSQSPFQLAAPVCPRFDHCGAAHCPVVGGKHLPSEPTCPLLRLAVKHGAEARFLADIPSNLAEVVLQDARRLLSTACALGRELRRASRHGSQAAQAERLNGPRHHLA